MLALRWILVLLGCTFPSVAQADGPIAEVKHTSHVMSIAVSADGKKLASGNAEGTIILSDLASGKELRRIETRSPVNGMAFSPDGRMLGVKTEAGPYSIYSLVEGAPTKSPLGMTGYNATLLAFTSDGASLIAAGVGEQLMWHHSRGGASASRTANRPAGSFAAISQDGALSGWGQANGWLQLQTGGSQPATPRQYHRLQVGNSQCMALAADSVLTGNSDKFIRLWNLGGQEVRKFEGMSEPAAHLAVSRNGKILAAAGTNDSRLRIWDLSSARMRRQVHTNLTGIRAMLLSPDGRSLVTASADKAQVWNIATRDLGVLGPTVSFSKTQLDQLWNDLGSNDYVTADNAFKKLAVGGKDAVSYLQGQIMHVAVPSVDWKSVDSWIKDLGAEAFPVRQKATTELAKLGELAEVPLKKVVEGKSSLEAANRATKLLSRLKEPEMSPERLRALQALDLLESLGCPASRQALDQVRRDSLIGCIRQEAGEALQRLSRQ